MRRATPATHVVPEAKSAVCEQVGVNLGGGVLETEAVDNEGGMEAARRGGRVYCDGKLRRPRPAAAALTGDYDSAREKVSRKLNFRVPSPRAPPQTSSSGFRSFIRRGGARRLSQQNLIVFFRGQRERERGGEGRRTGGVSLPPCPLMHSPKSGSPVARRKVCR